MAIPDYQTIMLPLLVFSSDKKTHKFREGIEKLAVQFNITEQERKMLLPSGTQAIFDNRVAWAKTYLKKAGLIDSPKRGTFCITEEGLKFLSSNPKKITSKALEKFESFTKFKNFKREKNDDNKVFELQKDEDKTPEEILESAFNKIKSDIAFELLETIKSCSYIFFENLVIDVLLKMGYGGSRADAGRAIGKSGDGGIDGIIKEDKLGLDIIYIQAKKWENSVPIKEIRDFAGSLLAKKARKGIFITTSNFTKNAYEFVNNIEHKIILIDGKYLTDLMIEYDVGLSTSKSYKIKKIDYDYFEE
jgi:restriction system protein